MTQKNRPQPHTPALMCLGLTSDAGKSVITAALCRIFTQDGLRVLPFKGQNMTSATCITGAGLIASHTQLVHAIACQQEPDPRMNPILLRPAPQGGGSEVIVLGKNTGFMSIADYMANKPHFGKLAKEAYSELAREADLMLIEGAGSPAEINLKTHDFVNMGMCHHARAQALLIGDIDRGGVFAHFVGTMHLLLAEEQQAIAGFLINKFRGDASLLDTALRDITRLTGKEFWGIIPYLSSLGLPEEDSLSGRQTSFSPTAAEELLTPALDAAINRVAEHVRKHVNMLQLYQCIEQQKEKRHG